MKISYVTTYDATGIKNWSGTGYYMAKSLADQHVELTYTGPLTEYRSWFFKTKQLFYSVVQGKNHLRDREPLILQEYAKQVAKQLVYDHTDVVFSPGTVPISYLECREPIAFWSDATFAGMLDFYPEFSNLSTESIENGHRMERSALSRSSLALYSSEWAAETAIKNYEVDSSKVRVVPFGANVEHNLTFEDIRRTVNLRPSNACKLLFLAVDWQRKGGNLALQVAKELNEQGLETELTVVGCDPDFEAPLPDFVKVLGFISKSSASGRKRLERLIAESHFLILPTTADATPIVFCEANAFGVPCLTTDVGGTSTVVKNDLNGRTFTKTDEPSKYCEYIWETMTHYSRYRQLALSSFNQYDTRLNWEVAGRTAKQLIEEYCV